MMVVEVSNDRAVVSRDGTLVPITGERVTTLRFPDSIGTDEARKCAVGAMKQHLAPGAKPRWVCSSDAEMQEWLVGHFGIEDNTRPADWGAR